MSKISARFLAITAQAPGYAGYEFVLDARPVSARKMVRGDYGYVGYSGLNLAWQGLPAGGWGDVFFDNVFISPSTIEAGLVTGDQTYEFAIWHSYRSSLTLRGVTEFGGDSIELTGIKSGLLTSFESTKYLVSLNQTPADTAYRAAFDFGPAGQYDFRLTASQAIVIHFPIDWGMQPEIRSSYLTETIESWNGAEQRISLRDQPRLSATYQYGLTDADQYLFSSLVGNFSGQYLVPIWPYQSELAEPVSRFDSKATVTDLSAWVVPGCRVMLSDADMWEICLVASVAGLEVAFSELVKKNYRSGARLVPVSQAWINDEVSSVAHGMDVEVTGASFDFDEVELLRPAPVDDFTIFNDRRVLDISPDRSRDCTLQYKRLRETLDPSIGGRYIHDRIQGAIKYLQFSWRFFDPKSRKRFDDFAELERGAQGEFYIESPLVAMHLVKDIEAPTLEITIAEANYKNFLKSNTFAPAIALKLYNGTVLYRNVESATRGLDSTEVVTLKESVENIKIDDVEYIAPLFLGRFESDEFAHTFDTPVDSSITKIIKQLIYVDPEIDREITIT
ncbi:hypothetical protein C4K05_2124 [Pseudomonas chlororaphis subsp. aureofaciens]|uniref:hypothetical protein n=1 Tax=Pseudomonas TaxID=286 RepID=UPI000F575DA8|nr:MULTISPECIES: hypothetical protein [Pseudomonas]AZE41474.1 hypothetical protein C4K05_2124 [Pseudomonas chlororaphis subsp. aureofaciens]